MQWWVIVLNNEQKILNLLGLANKAGKIVSGEDSVIKALQQKKAKIVFVASNSSSNTLDNFDKKCFFYDVPVCFDYSDDALSKAIGKTRRIIAITDQGFYEALKMIKEVTINEC